MSKTPDRQESGRRIPRWGALTAVVLVSAIAGCGARLDTNLRPSPAALARITVKPWTDHARDGLLLQSANYRLYTTVEDQAASRLIRVLEAALVEYRRLSPTVAASERPMDCYVFENRQQWARYTERHTGRDAAVYLQIVRGGYTVGDRFVAYQIGARGTDAVAAHEGWHQFVARHFTGRLPPFLEEGIACLFEHFQWEKDRPRWDLAVNLNRAQGLGRAVRTGNLWPLEQLISLHAGQIVEEPRARIDAFYAQNWAFARFLLEADDRRYRPALQRLLADAAAGTLAAQPGARAGWNPRTAGALLEHYLEMELPAIEQAYQRYLKQIVSGVGTGPGENARGRDRTAVIDFGEVALEPDP